MILTSVALIKYRVSMLVEIRKIRSRKPNKVMISYGANSVLLESIYGSNTPVLYVRINPRELYF